MATTVSSLLVEAIAALREAGVETPRLDAELLLAHLLGRERSWLWTYPEAEVPPAREADFRRLLARRQRREPLPYLLGEWEFYGRTFRVTPAVLTPRPETELLVEAVLDWARQHDVTRIVDVGVGSGSIAVTLAAELPAVRVLAIDLSPDALQVAQQNAEHHGVATRIDWLQGDLLQPLHAAGCPPVDVIVANLPYIAEEEMASLMPEVRDYEPRLALSAGEGGLHLIRRLIEDSPASLRPGGLLALEIGIAQAERVRSLLAERGWRHLRVIDDYAGIPRHVLAERPGK